MISSQQSSEFLPIRTVVKFYQNHDDRNHNGIFTKTLGKAAFVHRDFQDIEIKGGEFWVVDVLHDTKPGLPRGAFLLQPIKKIEHPEMLCRLLPGMYTEEEHYGVLILNPNRKELKWILPLTHKQALSQYHAVIIRH